MKICFVVPPMHEKSGWGRYAGDVMNGARLGGHQVSVVEVGNKGLIASLIRVVRKSRTADIVYAIDGWPFGVLAWLATRLWRKKLIIGAIGTYTIAPFYESRTRWLVSRAYGAADVVISISHYTAKRLLEKIPKAKIAVISPGTDLEKWQIDHIVSDHPTLLSVAAIKARKGYMTALEAFARARQHIPDLRWTIIGGQGDVALVGKFKQRAKELGVLDAINLVQQVSDEDLRNFYARAKIFMLLSENQGNHFEGFGIVFLEAAAAGLPVIGTSGNGIEDAIGPNNGIAVPQRDPRAAADAIVAILNDEVRWQSMSQASRRWAQEHQLDAMYTAHEEIYRKISGRM